MERWGAQFGRARGFLSTLGLLALLLHAPLPAVGAPPAGFPLQSSQASPVSGAVTISAPAVLPETGLMGVSSNSDRLPPSVAFVRAIRLTLPVHMLPDGITRVALLTAEIASSGEI